MEGFNGTVFAYGQTSSGKTHTMLGSNIADPEHRGMIPRMVSHVFDEILSAPSEIEFEIKVSMIEIYMEKIRDLIEPSKTDLKIREERSKGVYIENVTEISVAEEGEVYQIMKLGNENRAIGCTDMNAQSSRSHSCFIVTIDQRNTRDFSSRTGKLYLVDLAGSERVDKTGAAGNTLKEANQINKSLSQLGLVINNLTDGKQSHIPYRDSKLTRILQESLGGNAKTSLIITCSPAKFNLDETISTLKFGARAKRIKNKPKINKELSIQELQYLYEEEKKKNEIKTRRIRILEKIIKEMGGVVPKDTFGAAQGDLPEDTEDQKLQIPEIESNLKENEGDSLLDEEKKEEVKAPEPEIRYVEKIVEVIKAPPPTLKHHKTVQTDVIEEPELAPKVITETVTVEVPSEPVIETRVVERVVEKMVEAETDKIDDTEIERDEEGQFKIFEHVASPDDPDEKSDELTTEFQMRTKTRQIQILLAAIKHHMVVAEEANIKVAYVKKQYAEQLQKLVQVTHQLKEKDTEL